MKYFNWLILLLIEMLFHLLQMNFFLLKILYELWLISFFFFYIFFKNLYLKKNWFKADPQISVHLQQMAKWSTISTDFLIFNFDFIYWIELKQRQNLQKNYLVLPGIINFLLFYFPFEINTWSKFIAKNVLMWLFMRNGFGTGSISERLLWRQLMFVSFVHI